MEILNVVSVPIIAIIVYWTINLIKQATGESEKFKRLIPLISAVFGAVVGVIAYFAAPGVVPADNILMAIIIGGASGLSATGTNQIFKQMGKDNDEKNANNT